MTAPTYPIIIPTRNQRIRIEEFCRVNKATITGQMLLENHILAVTYSVPQAPAAERETAPHLPEWAEVWYAPMGTEKFFDSSWNRRRSARQTIQAATTGSLKIERAGFRIKEADGREFMVFQ